MILIYLFVVFCSLDYRWFSLLSMKPTPICTKVWCLWLSGFYMAIGTSGNQFKNAGVAGRLMREMIEARQKAMAMSWVLESWTNRGRRIGHWHRCPAIAVPIEEDLLRLSVGPGEWPKMPCWSPGYLAVGRLAAAPFPGSAPDCKPAVQS